LDSNIIFNSSIKDTKFWIQALAIGVIFISISSLFIFFNVSLNDNQLIIESVSILSKVVFQIFLFGIFNILFREILSALFIIYFRYAKISFISFLSKNLKAP
jgi:hypothetical protein